MKWPWNRHRDYDDRIEAARAALEKARQDRAEALAVAARARAMRERNGFADAIRVAMGVQK